MVRVEPFLGVGAAERKVKPAGRGHLPDPTSATVVQSGPDWQTTAEKHEFSNVMSREGAGLPANAFRSTVSGVPVREQV